MNFTGAGPQVVESEISSDLPHFPCQFFQAARRLAESSPKAPSGILTFNRSVDWISSKGQIPCRSLVQLGCLKVWQSVGMWSQEQGGLADLVEAVSEQV